jgi:hypothetical protein
MTWTADTLETGDPDQLQILPQNLLVFSSNDAWLCCWADGPLGQMWRYDGKDWTINDIGKDVSGKPADIVGLASNNLWTGGYIGDKVFLARYNGINWIDVYPGFYTVDPSKWLKGDILDMSVDVNGNIWACGRNGLVMKYENNKWISDTVNIFSGYTLSLSLRSTEFYKDKISLISETYDSNHRKYYYYYFSGTIDNWSLVDSMVLENPSSEIRFGNFGLHKGANNELYSFGLEGIWIRTNNIWEKIFDIDGEIYCMYTVNRDYIVTGSAYKKIFFYNGSHWENINDLFEIDDPTFCL